MQSTKICTTRIYCDSISQLLRGDHRDDSHPRRILYYFCIRLFRLLQCRLHAGFKGGYIDGTEGTCLVYRRWFIEGVKVYIF